MNAVKVRQDVVFGEHICSFSAWREHFHKMAAKKALTYSHSLIHSITKHPYVSNGRLVMVLPAIPFNNFSSPYLQNAACNLMSVLPFSWNLCSQPPLLFPKNACGAPCESIGSLEKSLYINSCFQENSYRLF